MELERLVRARFVGRSKLATFVRWMGYLLVHPACLKNDMTPLHVVQILCLAAALGGGLIAWQALRRERAGEAGGRGDRSRFLAGLGVWTSALFALVIVAQAVPSFVLHQCQ